MPITHDGIGVLPVEGAFKIGSDLPGNGFGIKEKQLRISYLPTSLAAIAVVSINFDHHFKLLDHFAELSRNSALCPYVDFIISASARD
jgi:hypothetical protein